MKTIFVLQPSGPEFKEVRAAIGFAAKHIGANPVWLDQFAVTPDHILDALFLAVEHADLIICDASGAGSGPMVGLGYARALKKPVVLITSRQVDFPGILLASRYLVYDLGDETRARYFLNDLTGIISKALENPGEFLESRQVENKASSVFISYSHKDQEFLRRLMTHLRPLEKRGLIDAWLDTKLTAGDDWKKEIENALDRSRVAILLISADFLASDFIVDNELPPLLNKAETKGTRIMPVILKPCRFSRDANLAKFHAINDPQSPMSLMTETDRESVYDTIAKEVERSVAQ